MITEMKLWLVECDVCKTTFGGSSGDLTDVGVIRIKTDFIANARFNGWTIGTFDKCPSCNQKQPSLMSLTGETKPL